MTSLGITGAETKSTCDCGSPDKELEYHESKLCKSQTGEPEELSKKAIMRKLVLVSMVCIVFMAIEIIGGVIASSLALLSDAAHLFSDFSGFAISIIALYVSSRTKKLPSGFSRAEVLGAMVNVLMIWILTIWLVSEAVSKIITPEDVDGKIMFYIACIGLVSNLIMMKVLHSGEHGCSHGGIGHSHYHGHEHAHNHSHSHEHHHHCQNSHDHKEEKDNCHEHDDEAQPLVNKQACNGEHHHHHEEAKETEKNINLRAAFIHILGDLIQSVGVTIAGALIWAKPEWRIADPICTFLFSVIVILTTVPIARDCFKMLMESSSEADHGKVKRDLESPSKDAEAHYIGASTDDD